MNVITRDDTEHGKEYVMLDEAQEVIRRLGEDRDEATRSRNRWKALAMRLASELRLRRPLPQESQAPLSVFDQMMKEDK